MADGPRMGTVARWDEDRGYGFITPDDGGGDVFAHARDVRIPAGLKPGLRVVYAVAIGRDNRPRAVRVSEPVEIFDPASLTPAENEQAGRLLDLLEQDSQQFDQFVLHSVREPTEKTQRVLQSTDLAHPVLDALYRLSVAADRRAVAAQAAGDRNALRMAQSDQRILGMERRRLGPYVHLALGDAANQGLRRRAARILERVRNRELRAIMQDLEDGVDIAEVKARAAQRAAQEKGEGHRVSADPHRSDSTLTARGGLRKAP